MTDNDDFEFIDLIDNFEDLQVTDCLGDGTKAPGDWISLDRKPKEEKEKASDPVDDETIAARTESSSTEYNDFTLPLYPPPVMDSNGFRKWLSLQDELSSKSAYDCITQKQSGKTEWLKNTIIADKTILNAFRSNVRNDYRHEQTSTTALARSILNSFAKVLIPYAGDKTISMKWETQDRRDTFVVPPEFESVEDMFLKVYQATINEPTDLYELL